MRPLAIVLACFACGAAPESAANTCACMSGRLVVRFAIDPSECPPVDCGTSPTGYGEFVVVLDDGRRIGGRHCAGNLGVFDLPADAAGCSVEVQMTAYSTVSEACSFGGSMSLTIEATCREIDFLLTCRLRYDAGM